MSSTTEPTATLDRKLAAEVVVDGRSSLALIPPPA
jgi:hypothetical protein